jgi:hypothetical protein
VKDYAILCIFLVSGRTFTFRDVSITSDNEFAVTFDYAAMSDGLSKTATFYKAQVAGLAKTEYAPTLEEEVS